MSSKSGDMKTPISSSQEKRKYAVGIIGSLLALCGLLCGFLWDTIYNSLIDRAMILRPNTKVFDFWKNPPVDIGLDIYLYNWTNPEEFRNFSTKPMLTQVGPYRFREVTKKEDVRWHPENASLSYRKKSNFYFDSEGSRGTLGDRVVSLNPVAVAASGKAKLWSGARRSLIDLALNLYGGDISMTKTVDELLFTGYDDLLLVGFSALSTLTRDSEVPFDKFGYCYKRNGSSALTGRYNIYTGADDILKLGQLNSWNSKKHTGKFEAHCGQVTGSAGELYPPYLKANGTTNVFIPELCRSMPLEYVGEVMVEGIKGFKYIGGQRAVDNGTMYPENKCFCGGQCVPSGLVNLSSCWFDAPVFMSFPHFYAADPYYLTGVDGLKPNKEDHEFYIVVEPRTGILLELAGRFQVNLMVEPIPYLAMFRKVPRVFFPLMWFETTFRVHSLVSADLKLLPVASLFGKVVSAIVCLLGLAMIAWYRMEPHFHRARSVNLTYCLNEGSGNGETDKTKKFATSGGSPIMDRSLVLGTLSKTIMPSTSMDSGCPNMDSVSSVSMTNTEDSEPTVRGGIHT